jgi:hypothetical protein
MADSGDGTRMTDPDTQRVVDVNLHSEATEALTEPREITMSAAAA